MFHLFLDAINSECNNLCQRSPANWSLFRKMPVSQMIGFKWTQLVSELEARAPLLLRALSTIVSRNDHRNQSWCITLSRDLHGSSCSSQGTRDVWCTVTDLDVFLSLWKTVQSNRESLHESALHLLHIYNWVVLTQTKLANVAYDSVVI